MISVKKIKLSEFYPILGNSECVLSCITHEPSEEYGENFKRPAMFVIPGGGYEFVSYREEDPVAARYYAEGFNCYCLRYSVKSKYPTSHLELACAVDYVNKHNDEFHNNGVKCFVGFSAGGHLVGSYGYLYEELADMIKVDPNAIKPSMEILAYPVITMNDFGHSQTMANITNHERSLIDKLSIENHITSSYPPTFVWSTTIDTIVPIKNSLVFIEKLKKNNVKFDSFIFDGNIDHGVSLSSFDTRYNYKKFNSDEINIRKWIDKSLDFYSMLFGEINPK